MRTVTRHWKTQYCVFLLSILIGIISDPGRTLSPLGLSSSYDHKYRDHGGMKRRCPLLLLGTRDQSSHDNVIKWNHFPRYWSFVRGIHRRPVHSPHKGQWRGALMFSLMCAWINGWVNNHEAGDLRRPVWRHCNNRYWSNIQFITLYLFINFYDFCISQLNRVARLTNSVVSRIYLRTPRGTLRRMWNGSWKSTRLIRWISFTSNEKSIQVFWYMSQVVLTLEAGNCPRERCGWKPPSSLIAERSAHSGKMLSTIFCSSITLGWCGRTAEDFAFVDRPWRLGVFANCSSSGCSHNVQFFARRK